MTGGRCLYHGAVSSVLRTILNTLISEITGSLVKLLSCFKFHTHMEGSHLQEETKNKFSLYQLMIWEPPALNSICDGGECASHFAWRKSYF